MVSTSFAAHGEKLIVVFDDYHEIHDTEIHRFVETFLMHLPDLMRIAIVTRRTPPIALGRLRSRNLVLDIRLQDLQFDHSAMKTLVKGQTGSDIDAFTLDRLTEITEGWPAGLRMLLLARANDVDMREYLTHLKGQVWQIQEYLVEEVLRQLPPKIALHIGATAILDRFSSSLCETLIDTTDDTGATGRQLVELIRNKGLFCIPLDESGEWYRYHPLFRDLLLRQVKSSYTQEEIRQLHSRAAKWLDSEGHIEDAIRHFLLAKRHLLAAAVILRYKDQLILQQHWRRLDSLIGSLPAGTVDNNVELLVLMVWVGTRMGRVSQVLRLVEIAREKLETEKHSGTVDDVVYGENCAQCAIAEYTRGNGQAAVNAADKALELLPQPC